MMRDYDQRRCLTSWIGASLREVREGEGLGIREAASRAGISVGMLSYLERGLRAPSGVVVERLVALYWPRLSWRVIDALRAEAVLDHGKSYPGSSHGPN
jgi:transcriptional regulator with XRE-family HTH domain